MALESSGTLYTWKADLPSSKIVCPEPFGDRLKYVFWRLYTPYHPYVRDSLLSLGIIRRPYVGRQNFIIGRIAPHESVESVVKFLISRGYGNHFIAWIDEGEVVGLRYVENFKHQYHIRIFADGEVRGHYEYTTECYPILHFKAVGQEDRREEFLKLLGERIISIS